MVGSEISPASHTVIAKPTIINSGLLFRLVFISTPQLGHFFALLLVSWLHSLHFVSAIGVSPFVSLVVFGAVVWLVPSKLNC